MDATKFDVTRFFQPEVVLEHAEKHVKNCTGFIANSDFRKMTETFSTASFDFARSQLSAARTFGETVQKAFQI